MTSKKINTGIESLDHDLTELFNICSDKSKLKQVKAAIRNHNISSDEFKKLVPDNIITLYVIFTGPMGQANIESTSTEAQEILLEAKNVLETQFDGLLLNPRAKESMQSEKETEDKEETLRGDCINRIAGVTYLVSWIGSPPSMVPSLRIGFKNPTGKIMLDSTLDWEDTGVLLDSVSGLLVELLESGKSLAKCKNIDFADFEKLNERIERTDENMQKIKEALKNDYAPFAKSKATKKKAKVVKEKTKKKKATSKK